MTATKQDRCPQAARCTWTLCALARHILRRQKSDHTQNRQNQHNYYGHYHGKKSFHLGPKTQAAIGRLSNGSPLHRDLMLEMIA